MRRRGHPILGTLSGFLCGLGATVTLVTTGTVNIGSVLVTIIPLAGLVVGLVLGLTAPLGANIDPR